MLFIRVMSAYQCTVFLILWFTKSESLVPPPAIVVSKNGSLTSILDRFRSKRASYIDSEPRLLESLPFNAAQAQALVDEHNRYRRVVLATNMQMLKWDPYLAAQAQAHANTCVFAHSQNRENAGENIYVAYGGENYMESIKLWFYEVYDSQCACSTYFKECCGHYTQLVWAESNRVGCGFAHCRSVLHASWQHYALVCQYSPQGNLLLLNNDGTLTPLPAYTYRNANDRACSQCPSGLTCNNGLCDSA